MKCNKIIKRFLELENFLTLPLRMRWHILWCENCKEEISLLQDRLVEIRKSQPFVMKEDMTEVIMNSIYANTYVLSNNISSTKWVTVGTLIFLSIIGITFSDSIIWLKSHFGVSFEVPLSIVMGLAITIYVSLYIGTHIEETRKFIGHFTGRVH